MRIVFIGHGHESSDNGRNWVRTAQNLIRDDLPEMMDLHYSGGAFFGCNTAYGTGITGAVDPWGPPNENNKSWSSGCLGTANPFLDVTPTNGGFNLDDSGSEISLNVGFVKYINKNWEALIKTAQAGAEKCESDPDCCCETLSAIFTKSRDAQAMHGRALSKISNNGWAGLVGKETTITK